MSTKVLFVDDDENILAGYQRSLRKQFSIDTAPGGAQALVKMESEEPYAVVVADMQMPKMNGIEFLKQVEAKAPETVRLMLTGNADQKTAADAVNLGHVFRFLNKPCTPESMAVMLQAGLQQHRLIIAEREVLETTLNGAVRILTDVLSTIDPQAFGRAQQLRDYMRTFLHSFKVNKTWELELAAMLSPIGRVTVPPPVLMKERAGLSLSAAEKVMFLRVPEVGAELLERIPRLDSVAQIVRFQKKNFDGSGFPDDSSGGDHIPIGARILKVLGDLVELESKGVSKGGALNQMQQAAGSYDPQVLSAACRSFDIALLEASEKMPPPIAVRVHDLRLGQVLAQDVKTLDGILMLTAGSVLSPMQTERLRNFRALGTIADTVLVNAE
jgi:response regulator RpfG family c-di-GMP phosphodiesterase